MSTRFFLSCSQVSSQGLYTATAAEPRGLTQPPKQPSEDVQTALAEAINWLVALASAIFARSNDTHMPKLHMYSTRREELTPEQREERTSHRSSMQEIAAQFATTKNPGEGAG